MVDVDHFKTVNDKFGHLYGDEVLILIANLLQSSFRSQDRVFRFGGEEFVVLLRSTTLENAQKIIDRFRTNVETYEFPQVGTGDGQRRLRQHQRLRVAGDHLGRADQALYYAKSHGRNQACHYDQLVSGGLLQAVAVERHRRILLNRPAAPSGQLSASAMNRIGSTFHFSGDSWRTILSPPPKPSARDRSTVSGLM